MAAAAPILFQCKALQCGRISPQSIIAAKETRKEYKGNNPKQNQTEKRKDSNPSNMILEKCTICMHQLNAIGR